MDNGRQRQRYYADGNMTDTWAAADANCDTQVTFIDVGYFVAGLSSEENWKQYYRDHNGGAEPPCPYLNADANGDGNIDFLDIGALSNMMGNNSAMAREFVWDAENRLLEVRPADGATLPAGAKKVAFEYDYVGRRITEEGVDVRHRRGRLEPDGGPQVRLGRLAVADGA